MNWIHILLIILILCFVVIVYLILKLYKVSEKLSIIEDSLDDIKQGNLNRRILVRENDMTKTICYSINDMVTNNQVQLIKLKQSEQAYKRLMTSLSHDVKTPLTSLVGYLEAVQERIVTGEEKEEYLEVALTKAHHLKGFVESLFDWVKLDAKEQGFQLERQDINELTRDILTDWIPTFEENNFEYNIDISDTECFIQLDPNAFIRIINNLLQNVLIHSEGTQIDLQIGDKDHDVIVQISDNGKGIPTKDLPHIFDRLYQSDESRSVNGNGLGLAIAKELVHLHNGSISADNSLNGGMTFTIIFPKAL
ncbi:sensor histidine kinase [Lysinibacillus pakistanensis]|uniref:histidine kinase n=1 Tax=Lysinibacillus pakistanensis TaxID=759811 RepID=A0AAX3WQ11_9BACI|nr:HAMP domain-containing sensor histidine kinase [Lysinibacillus pakistanensis]MDM5234311.1 HAMP domain-containing sensor histidine kinase [Lysinibacillus pakistanensis]WHY44900.1 HAMP domain-containing sensor histidine kinase [Lysinibacillus pakistanensis]WHY49907.1 HAMP domain-containing sensor histidine kinase [Lysinibacillus pakistanensis]